MCSDSPIIKLIDAFYSSRDDLSNGVFIESSSVISLHPSCTCTFFTPHRASTLKLYMYILYPPTERALVALEQDCVVLAKHLRKTSRSISPHPHSLSLSQRSRTHHPHLVRPSITLEVTHPPPTPGTPFHYTRGHAPTTHTWYALPLH